MRAELAHVMCVGSVAALVTWQPAGFGLGCGVAVVHQVVVRALRKSGDAAYGAGGMSSFVVLGLAVYSGRGVRISGGEACGIWLVNAVVFAAVEEFRKPSDKESEKKRLIEDAERIKEREFEESAHRIESGCKEIGERVEKLGQRVDRQGHDIKHLSDLLAQKGIS